MTDERTIARGVSYDEAAHTATLLVNEHEIGGLLDGAWSEPVQARFERAPGGGFDVIVRRVP